MLLRVAEKNSGEFLGVVADDPGKEMKYRAFHAKILRGEVVHSPSQPLPIVRKVPRRK